MTKHWVMYILAAIGLTALALWIYKRLTSSPATAPHQRDPIVSVSTDDPNMIVPSFNFGGKPLWDATWLLDANRGLTTTYAKKE